MKGILLEDGTAMLHDKMCCLHITKYFCGKKGVIYELLFLIENSDVIAGILEESKFDGRGFQITERAILIKAPKTRMFIVSH